MEFPSDDSIDDDSMLFRSPLFDDWKCAFVLEGANNKSTSGYIAISRNFITFRDSALNSVGKIAAHSVTAIKRNGSEPCVLIRFTSPSRKSQQATVDFVGDGDKSAKSCADFFLEALTNVLETRSADATTATTKKTTTPSVNDAQRASSMSVNGEMAQAVESIDTKPGNKREIKWKSFGFQSLVSAEVTSPLVVDASSSAYVVYAVQCHITMLHQAPDVRPTQWLVYHRYSDFEALDKQLRRQIAQHLDSKLIALPLLPPKPWIPVGQFGADWLQSRARKLHRYLNALLRIPALLEKAHYLETILKFISVGEVWEERDEVEDQSAGQGTWTRALERGLYGVNKALGKMLDTQDTPSAVQDYEYIKQVFQGYQLKPHKVPWEKQVISIMGTTSSGKSSLISHLLTLTCTASSGAGQVDTGFSLIESIPETEFALFSQLEPSDAPLDLDAPLLPASQNLRSDPRYGRVFVYLNAEETLQRYSEQLGNEKVWLSKYHKIRCVLVNERYLQGSPQRQELARSILLIDSKGIDASTLGGGEADAERGMRYMEAEIRAFQFFTKVAHLTLFLMPAHDIRNCEAALSVFELATVCSEEGMAFMRKEIRKSASQPRETHHHYESDPVSGLVSRMLGLQHFYGAAQSVGSWVGGKVSQMLMPQPSARDIDHGTARWEKTFFILSRVDEVYHSADNRHGDANAIQMHLYYEMGLAFGRRLHYLQPPTFSRIFPLGLPEKQYNHENKCVGFLATFHSYLTKQIRCNGYEQSRDDAIISMCDQLEKEMSQGWVNATWFKWQAPYIRRAKRRALKRRYSMTPM